MVSILRAKNGEQDSQSSSDRKAEAPQSVRSSHIIAEHIDVGVPSQTAFDQWTQYDKWQEIFKKESANRGRKSGERGPIKVSAKIGPSRRQWTAEIVEIEPGRRLSWRSKGGLDAKGTTTFHSLDDRLTTVMVEIQYKPSGFFETVGNFFRMQRRRVRRDLRLFKNYIELRGEATGKGPRRSQGQGLKDEVDHDRSGGSEAKDTEEK